MKITGYYVKGCKISRTEMFSGYILNKDDEPIIESIKRRLGVDNLLCELTNEGFEYDKVNVYSIPLTELCLGDYLMLIYDKK